MLQEFQKHIDTNFPFLRDKKLLIAISGGLDSVVLTELLHKLNFDISLAHCNFKLREKESDLDEEFVISLGEKLDLKTFAIQFNTEEYSTKNKVSTQIAARELRYSWFDDLIEEHHFDFLLTAHHANDNLETFLINLTRGTGLDGLTGIPVINGKIVRPLLVFSREEITHYATDNKIEWREDKSNASTKYIRNKIRHQVVPILKEINPSLLETFAKTSENLQESNQIIEDSIEKITSEVIEKDFSSELEMIKVDIKKIKQLSNPKAYLYQLLKSYEYTEWNDVYGLLDGQSGKQVLSKTHRLIKDREFLLLTKKKPFDCAQGDKYYIAKDELEISSPIHLTFKESNQNSSAEKNCIDVDKDLLKFPLIVRKWQKGDYFYPVGMQGKKKLSKYFKDEKFSLINKEQTWLLCNNDNDIIWIINKRQDRRFSTNKTTENKIEITFK
ncbi:tRNA(Ile)-lysidine synthase [Lutibacter sp. Hel_I_33_5]|nr:tRNA lysidine(34) synthetase TilS [Lutibacter sp. Hel_I_33_5]TVZ56082.1 tRNA(Ile)-lysidine synthase [Lutibacter sp. Hel_I_33_5]